MHNAGMSASPPIHPITEDDIADFLVNTPDFFERQASLLASVQLTSPHGGRAVSLQERQAEMLREKIKLLEHRIMDMVRHGNENMLISERLLRWARAMFRVRQAADLPARMADEIAEQFAVPQVALKVWGVREDLREQPFAQGVSEDIKSLANSLASPYCGVNEGFEAVGWLAAPEDVASVALIALRAEAGAPAFGLLVLASPDSQRFQAGMGTDFLEHLAEVSSDALARLRD